MKSLAVTVGVGLAVTLMGCGGGGSTTVAVSISPTSTLVRVGQTQQFTATVSHASNAGILWEVNQVTGGNSTVGTISTSGLYTAPLTVPNPSAITVTAVSEADTTQAASANVTVGLPISISPSNAAVSVSQAQQFTATVTLSTNTAVTWQVNGVAGGNSTVGTISTSGLYTAPASVPIPNTVTVTAVSQADTTQTASASLTINPPPLVVAPTGAVVSAGAQQTFTATANGQSVTPTWSVRCSQFADSCGTISMGGVYTAPLSPPPGGTVTVMAAMPGGTSLAATTTLSVQFANASLTGSYAFAFTIQASQGLSAEAGTVTFDGNGNITAGTADRSDDGGTPLTITGGSYQVGIDGRGTAVVQTDHGTVAWQLVIANHSQGFVVRFDTNGAAASGTLDLQSSTPLSLGSVQGGYTISLTGLNAGVPPTPFAMAGGLTTDGAGNISRALLDIDSNSAVTENVSGTGTYTAPSSGGRGTLTISSAAGAQSFVYYQVDRTRLKLVETDGSRAAAGDLVQQPTGPFTNASFQGRFAFTLSGSSGAAPFGAGGLFTLDGSAGIGNRLVDGLNQTVLDTQGSYFVTDAALGRMTATWTVSHGSNLQYVLYPRNDGGFVMLEVDGTAVAAGVVLPQALSNPTVFSLEGHFAADLMGTELPGTSMQEDITGQMLFPGGTPFSGTFDVDNNGAVTQGALFQAGTFVVDPNNGRGEATSSPSSSTLGGGTTIFYLLDSGRALLLENDSARVLTGVVAKQY